MSDVAQDVDWLSILEEVPQVIHTADPAVQEVWIPSKEELLRKNLWLEEQDVLMAIDQHVYVGSERLTQNIQYWVGQSSPSVIGAALRAISARSTVLDKGLISMTLLGWYGDAGIHPDTSTDSTIADLVQVWSIWGQAAR